MRLCFRLMTSECALPVSSIDDRVLVRCEIAPDLRFREPEMDKADYVHPAKWIILWIAIRDILIAWLIGQPGQNRSLIY